MNTYDHEASINITKHYYLNAIIASVIFTITKIYTVPPNTTGSVFGDTKMWIFKIYTEKRYSDGGFN